jgi:hypothetical protein
MKVSFLISGHPNIYRECYESFSNIDLDVDKYASFWWDDSYQNKFYKMHFSEKTSHFNMAEELINKLKPKKYKIEKYKYFDISFVESFNRETWSESDIKFYRLMTPIVLYGLLSQTYSTRNSFNLTEDISEVYIRSRSDLILTKPLKKIISNLDFESNKIYFQSSMNGGHLYAGEFPNKPCDWFFAGNRYVMDLFTKNWHSIIFEIFKNGIIHTNDLLKIVCDRINIEYDIVDFGAIIYKQSNDYYEKYHNNIEYYFQNFDFEVNNIKNIDNWPLWVKNINFKHFKNLNFLI